MDDKIFNSKNRGVRDEDVETLNKLKWKIYSNDEAKMENIFRSFHRDDRLHLLKFLFNFRTILKIS